MEQFEEKLRQDLHQFLHSMKEVDERFPDCPDVEGKWEEIAKAYIPDGIREFQDYPSASPWMDDVCRHGCSQVLGHGMGDLFQAGESVCLHQGQARL